MHSAFKNRPKKPTQPPKSDPHHKNKPQRSKTSHQQQQQQQQQQPHHNTRTKSAQPAKLWLREIVGDDSFAREVQMALGEQITLKLLRKIKKQRALEQIPLYVITPTYRRPEQQAELTRLAQTLMHVPNMYWLLVEDSKEKTPLVTSMLRRWDIRTIHLNTNYRPPPEEVHGNPRGVNCRNRALKWIRENADEGVLYFADDDNTYDVELFQEIRSTKKVSMFPVGLVTQIGLSTPIVRDGKFVAFCDGWMGTRKFPVDMAGFAVNIDFLSKRPNAQMPYKEGLQEDSFLKSLAPFEPNEIELKANNCTKLLVWHTQTVDYRHLRPPTILSKYPDTNLVQLMETIVYSR